MQIDTVLAEIEEIRNISSWAANKIKDIVQRALQNIKLPKMVLGVRDNIPREVCSAEGMLGSVDITVYAVEQERPAITLYKDDRFWKEAKIVLLTPEGIFRCGYVMSESTKTDLIQSRPDWKYRTESPSLWIEFGETAIQELNKLKK